MKRKTLIGIALLVGAAGATYYFYSKPSDTAKKDAPPVPVTVITLKQESVSLFIDLPGRTTARKIAEVRPQIDGIIRKRLFEEGDLVKAGTSLYEIERAPYQALYNRAQADLKKAVANSKSIQAREGRYRELVKIGAVSKQDYDDITASFAQAQADIAIAQANAETAKINLDYTHVYAPITGRIGRSNLTEGALASAAQAQLLTTITQLDPIYVDLNQSSTELMEIRDQLSGAKKIPVTLFVEGKSEPYAKEGQLEFSDVTVDPTTGNVGLRAIFPNPDTLLLPGLFIRARINFPASERILIPQQAAIRNPDGTLNVWKVSADNKVTLTPIKAHRAIGSHWLLEDGASAGDIIVTKGFQKITPGASVAPTEEGANPTADAATPTPTPTK